jgi:hypothetical protein
MKLTGEHTLKSGRRYVYEIDCGESSRGVAWAAHIRDADGHLRDSPSGMIYGLRLADAYAEKTIRGAVIVAIEGGAAANP